MHGSTQVTTSSPKQMQLESPNLALSEISELCRTFAPIAVVAEADLSPKLVQ